MQRYSLSPLNSPQPDKQAATGNNFASNGLFSPRENVQQLGSLRNSPEANSKVSRDSFLQGMKASLSQRKQSHDLRSNRSNTFSVTMGSGLKDPRAPLHNTLISPRSVIQEARQQISANTIQDGLSVQGSRKNGWENPNSTARNGMLIRDGKLSVQDIIDNIQKKAAFGIDDYNPKPMVKDLLPVHTHVPSKSKRRTFVEETMRLHEKIPAPNKYQSAIDWNKDPNSRTIKFYKDARKTVADTIIAKSKHPEKSTPGPAQHESFKNWQSLSKKIPGTMKINEKRITFV